MQRLVIIAAIAGAALPAGADEICDDLWFTRNLVFDRAGYCFGSALGQAVFDNEGCTTQTPEIGSDGQRLIAAAIAREAEFDCDLDTSRTELDAERMDLRREITELPLRSDGESACIGWTGSAAALRAARDDIAPLTGMIAAGDTLQFRFDDVDGWSFVEIDRADGTGGAGWTREEVGEDTCTALAG